MQAGLVTVHQQGTRRLYEIDPKGVMAMRNYLDSMWDTALHAFKTAAENERKKEK
ncbi:MAG: ArsR family transcriptional regulator [Massilia sp.]|nr:ArsR family transcriptional regulator [Massilia sp.]